MGAQSNYRIGLSLANRPSSQPDIQTRHANHSASANLGWLAMPCSHQMTRDLAWIVINNVVVVGRDTKGDSRHSAGTASCHGEDLEFPI